MAINRGRGLGSFSGGLPNPLPQSDLDEIARREQGPAPAKADQNYQRYAVSPPDSDGYVWIVPSATSNPIRPRTKAIGYNIKERRVRTVFRQGSPASPNATWAYDDVSPQEWERLRRVSSTGKYINRVLNSHPYGRDEFERPSR